MQAGSATSRATNTQPVLTQSLTHRVGDAGGRPAEHEDGHRDEHDEGRAPLLLLQGPAVHDRCGGGG